MGVLRTDLKRIFSERASPLKKKASAARIRRFSESSNECADAFYFVCDRVVQ